ncbi:MAG: type II secretion system protein N, partial [Woeseia sp.]
MTNWKRLLIAGGVVFLLGLITMLPARGIHHWVSPAELQLAGIDGTVWNGAANEALMDGIYLQNLRWKIRPFAVFTG